MKSKFNTIKTFNVKNTIKWLLAFTVIAASVSCKKTNEDKPVEPAPSPITIDGKAYPTVKIGEQIWTTTNYAGTGGKAYDNNNSKPVFGKYYTYTEMKAIVPPAGWRIPTMADFKLLAATAGIVFEGNNNNTDAIRKLTATSGWLHTQGSNTLGFTAHPAGYMVNNTTPFGGDNAEFWASDGYTFSLMETGNQQHMQALFYVTSLDPNDRFNIRFVKK